MYEKVCSGIRKYKSGTYAITVNLPAREGYKEKSYSFHIGTVKTLAEAKSIRDKALDIVHHSHCNDTIEELKQLKQNVSLQRLTKKRAAMVLSDLLDDHDRIYGDHTLGDGDPDDDYYDEEDILKWKAERQALEMAIKYLRK